MVQEYPIVNGAHVFRIYHSNKLDVLKGILGHLLKHDPLNNPFESEKILVQSPGMAQWLKMELSTELGICANIEFPLPASFIWQTFVDVLDDVPSRSAFNKDAMAWQIITRLPHFLAREEFKELASYLVAQEPLKLYQLAYKIADIYDQYLVYRPHWIKEWQKGSLRYCEAQPWQGILWQDVAQTIIDSGQSHYHRANLYEHLIEALDNLDAAHRLKLPKRIFVFGVSALPPKYLEALQAISQHCDIHFFLNNPCQVYWGDIVDRKWLNKLQGHKRQSLGQAMSINSVSVKESELPLLSDNANNLFTEQGELLVGNPLLASMGKLGRDNQALMLELQAQEIEAFSPSEPCENGLVSLLGAVSDDILNLHDSTFIGQSSDQLKQGHKRKPVSDDDQSIIIQSCHSPMREVEVLHDQLLDMLANDSSLTPKDIVVMMPDVNAYSPYIQAVFSSAKHRIDFSISDRSAKQENPVLLSFLTLLDLANLRQTSNELFNLLEVPAIMNKFSLNVGALRRLKLWIEESGIRHGLGEANHGLDKTQDNSWQFGLNRMFKGYSHRESRCPDEESLWQNIYAYEESSGLVAEDLGQLALFIELISKYKMLLRGAKSFTVWQNIIESMLSDFFEQSMETEYELRLISECLTGLSEQLQLAHFTMDIASEVLFDHLSSNLSAEQSSQRFLAGKLNFCTLMPMRSIPFKVVCVLGMNDGVYPRTIAPLGFDLMADAPQKGDRCRRDDDRYLFLEALLSAQQRFYISYCGHNIKDNSVRCPSVLITELTDYICQSYRLERDEKANLEQCSDNMLAHLLTEHPLVPFNEIYYKPNDENLFSYQSDWLQAVDIKLQQLPFIEEPLPLNNLGLPIDIEQLKRFIKQPCQTFLNQRLGVYLAANDSELTDSEPFDPDGLQSYLIKSNLLDSYINGDSGKQLARLRAQGVLPHGHFADLFLNEHKQSMSDLANHIKPHLFQQLEDIQVNLLLKPAIESIPEEIANQIDNDQALQLQGWLKQHIAPNALIRYKSGKANAKFFVDCYIDYLAFCAIEQPHPPGDVLMVTQDGQWRFKPLPVELARAHLSRLIAYYLVGNCQPLPLFIQSGWNYIKERFDSKSLELVNDEKSIVKAEKALFEGITGNERVSGEGENPYNQRCFPKALDVNRSELIATSIEILLPIFVQLEELSDE